MTTASRRVTRRLSPALILASTLAVAAGCGPARYPVSGKVVFEDGSPLTEGTVVGETTLDGKKVMTQGEVKRDGTFTWGTKKDGDGARPGKYRVFVAPRALGDSEIADGKTPAVDDKYTTHDTSEITFEVKEGPNELKITVKKPVPKPAPETKPDADPTKEPDPKKAPDGKPETPPDPKKEPDPKKNSSK